VKTYKSDIYSVNDKGARVLVETVETLELPEAIARLQAEAKVINDEEVAKLAADPKYKPEYVPTTFVAPTSVVK